MRTEVFPDLADEALFPRLSEGKLAWLGERGVQRTFQPGEVLYEHAVRDAPFYIVEGGLVEFVDRKPGKDVHIAEADGGTFIGDIAAFTGEPTISACVAVEPTDTIAFDRGGLRDMVARWPEFGELIFRTLMARRAWHEENGYGVMRLIAARGSRRSVSRSETCWSATSCRLRRLGRSADVRGGGLGAGRPGRHQHPHRELPRLPDRHLLDRPDAQGDPAGAPLRRGALQLPPRRRARRRPRGHGPRGPRRRAVRARPLRGDGDGRPLARAAGRGRGRGAGGERGGRGRDRRRGRQLGGAGGRPPRVPRPRRAHRGPRRGAQVHDVALPRRPHRALEAHRGRHRDRARGGQRHRHGRVRDAPRPEPCGSRTTCWPARSADRAAGSRGRGSSRAAGA